MDHLVFVKIPEDFLDSHLGLPKNILVKGTLTFSTDLLGIPCRSLKDFHWPPRGCPNGSVRIVSEFFEDLLGISYGSPCALKDS